MFRRKRKDSEEALQGAQDIIAEMISDDADHRLYIHNITVEEGIAPVRRRMRRLRASTRCITILKSL